MTGREAGGRRGVLAVVAAGGALGSLARWSLAELLPAGGGAFPWATFTANVSGCLLLGALTVVLTDVWPPTRYARPFLAVGVLGGFTTFSAYVLETRALLAAGHGAVAAAYVAGSVVAGLAAVWLGVAAVRAWLPGSRPRSRAGGRGVGGQAG